MTVEILDVRGRVLVRLVDREVGAGAHSVAWHPQDLPSGTYLCRLATTEGTGCRKILLLK